MSYQTIDDSLGAVIALWNEKELDDRTVKVNETCPMEERPRQKRRGFLVIDYNRRHCNLLEK